MLFLLILPLFLLANLLLLLLLSQYLLLLLLIIKWWLIFWIVQHPGYWHPLIFKHIITRLPSFIATHKFLTLRSSSLIMGLHHHCLEPDLGCLMLIVGGQVGEILRIIYGGWIIYIAHSMNTIPTQGPIILCRVLTTISTTLILTCQSRILRIRQRWSWRIFGILWIQGVWAERSETLVLLYKILKCALVLGSLLGMGVEELLILEEFYIMKI